MCITGECLVEQIEDKTHNLHEKNNLLDRKELLCLEKGWKQKQNRK